MLELLAFIAINGPAVFDEDSKEYQIISCFNDMRSCEVLEEQLNMIGYEIFYESSSDCWVVIDLYK